MAYSTTPLSLPYRPGPWGGFLLTTLTSGVRMSVGWGSGTDWADPVWPELCVCHRVCAEGVVCVSSASCPRRDAASQWRCTATVGGEAWMKAHGCVRAKGSTSSGADAGADGEDGQGGGGGSLGQNGGKV